MELKIFLSHHETETEIAQKIRRFLKSTSGGEIEVETFVDQANRNSDFRTWIPDALKESDVFVFLYTDDARELSWAAHELGIYLGMRSGKQPNVVCLRSRDIQDMPKVMSHISPIDATDEGIEGFLADLLVNGSYSDGKRLALADHDDEFSAQISAKAKELAGLFQSKIHTQYFADRLIIRNIDAVRKADFDGKLNPDCHVLRSVPNRDEGGETEYVIDFSNVKVETNQNVEGILRLPPNYRWFDLVRLGQQLGASENAVDRFHLARELLQHAESEHFHSAAEMMLSDIEINGRILVPIISRVETRDRLPISYYLLLIPDPASRHEEIGSHEDLADDFARDTKIVLMLVMARRFRWNVVEPYVWKIRRAIGKEDELRQVLDEFMAGVHDIEEESARCKIDDGRLAVLHFPKQHRDSLQRLWVSYSDTRLELDKAVAANDARTVLEILNHFQQINRKFMTTALDVYKDMITDLPTLDENSENWRDEFFPGVGKLEGSRAVE